MLKRRLGKDPKDPNDPGGGSSDAESCPDIWELDNGDFMIIGTDRTSDLRPAAGTAVAVAEYERMVVIPRSVLLAAKKDIPDH